MKQNKKGYKTNHNSSPISPLWTKPYDSNLAFGEIIAIFAAQKPIVTIKCII